MTQGSTWESQAENWLAWARTPGHDVFPLFAPTFFEEIVPAPAGRTLEVGCGEGRVMRELVERGHVAMGLDGSPTLVRHGRELDNGSAYVVGDATALPFDDATFDVVIAYNSLQTMTLATDMAAAIAETGRVLKPGGHLCACVAHPMSDVLMVGAMSSSEGQISGSYFEKHRVEETVTQKGLTMTFYGWTHTLEDYARAIEDAGMSIEMLREPRPAGGGSESRRWQRMPLFLFLRAVKRAG